jgi:hypothetical protein
VVEEGQQDVQAGGERAAVAPEPLDDADEGLRDDANRLQQHDHHEHDHDHDDDHERAHCSSFGMTTPGSRRTTRAVTPATDSMRTTAPGGIEGSSSPGVRAVQYSEPTRI